mgnify:FL=1
MNQNSNSDKDDNNPKKESDLIKFFKKRSFIYLMCAVVFVVFFVPDLIQEDELEQKLTKNLDDQQKIAVDIMKSYQGVDAQGLRLFDAVMIQIENAYPTEKILEHKDTVFELNASDMQVQKGNGIYEVHLTFKTYNLSKEYIWDVNVDTDEIMAVNDNARKMLNIVDNYD